MRSSKIQLFFIILAKLSIQLLSLDTPLFSLSREFYKTRKTGTRNSGATAEHWWNNGTLVEQKNRNVME